MLCPAEKKANKYTAVAHLQFFPREEDRQEISSFFHAILLNIFIISAISIVFQHQKYQSMLIVYLSYIIVFACVEKINQIQRL